MDAEKEKLAGKLGVDLAEINDLYEAEQLIVDNKIEFEAKGIYYRVRKPTLAEQQKCNKAKTKKYLELVNNPDFLFKEQWIAKYKEKDIDIIKIEEGIIESQEDINKLLLRLATTDSDKEVMMLKGEITDAREKQVEFTVRKADLLSYSIEDNLAIFVNSYMTYLVLEKQIEDEKWIIAFNTYEEFENYNDMDLINKTFKHSASLLYGYES